MNSMVGGYHCFESIGHNRHLFKNGIYSKYLAKCSICKVGGTQTIVFLSFPELRAGGAVGLGFTAGT